jgi:hypothetical protein
MGELTPGAVVNREWTITEMLGAGAFGSLYLCRSNEGMIATLKTEPLDAQPPLLGMEVSAPINLINTISPRDIIKPLQVKVLQELHRLRDGRHFTKCLDLGRDTQPDGRGRPATFHYIV